VHGGTRTVEEFRQDKMGRKKEEAVLPDERRTSFEDKVSNQIEEKNPSRW